MAVITTGNHPKALWPGVHKFVMGTYPQHELECKKIFEMLSSRQHREEEVEITSFGLVPVKDQGSATTYTDHSQGGTATYLHTAYSMGVIVTKEELDDNLYKRAFDRAKTLMFSFVTTKEYVAANVLNRGFNSSYTGGVDSNELFATDHATVDGTQSNKLAVDADLSEASLEDLMIDIDQATNSAGLEIKIKPKMLVIPPALRYEAARILESTLRPGTANNDINAMNGVVPFTVNHYLTDSDAWFIKTDAPDGMKCFMRTDYTFTRDNEFDTDNLKMKGYERYSFGWTDWRGMYGSQGA